jgi:hypothetical protein
MSLQSCGKSIVSLTYPFLFGHSQCRSAGLGSSKQLPREQRRGAIIILGMLAVANRSVVSEKVETLIKIGLGSLGKVRSG